MQIWANINNGMGKDESEEESEENDVRKRGKNVKITSMFALVKKQNNEMSKGKEKTSEKQGKEKKGERNKKEEEEEEDPTLDGFIVSDSENISKNNHKQQRGKERQKTKKKKKKPHKQEKSKQEREKRKASEQKSEPEQRQELEPEPEQEQEQEPEQGQGKVPEHEQELEPERKQEPEQEPEPEQKQEPKGGELKESEKEKEKESEAVSTSVVGDENDENEHIIEKQKKEQKLQSNVKKSLFDFFKGKKQADVSNSDNTNEECVQYHETNEKKTLSDTVSNKAIHTNALSNTAKDAHEIDTSYTLEDNVNPPQHVISNENSSSKGSQGTPISSHNNDVLTPPHQINHRIHISPSLSKTSQLPSGTTPPKLFPIFTRNSAERCKNSPAQNKKDQGSAKAKRRRCLTCSTSDVSAEGDNDQCSFCISQQLGTPCCINCNRRLSMLAYCTWKKSPAFAQYSQLFARQFRVSIQTDADMLPFEKYCIILCEQCHPLLKHLSCKFKEKCNKIKGFYPSKMYKYFLLLALINTSN
ncbi:hypothetical protein RFI_18251 [Reticulomyxa filosa]|uniref:Uncharacterized protein n=1 Tax=Reticulomyxa filosa TaxID=46433 RepID=X6MZB9_RETFI|nr:hypothetical protein RFI_18251 [Reticulomyxa filosa]|eukprot:ETO18988.1 hypothetical protein RFI_18251 [Reticulomyxa filosa]